MLVYVTQNIRAAPRRLLILSFTHKDTDPPTDTQHPIFHASLAKRLASERAEYRPCSHSIGFKNSPRLRSERCPISSWVRISENADLSSIWSSCTALQIYQPGQPQPATVLPEINHIHSTSARACTTQHPAGQLHTT